MVKHLGNGNVKIGYKSYPINWTGQYAQHIAENFINEKQNHTILHIEIQQALSRCPESCIVKDGNNTYSAYKEISNGTIFVSFIKHNNLATITTGYKMNTTTNKAMKNKIGKSIQTIEVDKTHIDIWVNDGVASTPEEAETRLRKLFTKMYKNKGYKNFEIVFV